MDAVAQRTTALGNGSGGGAADGAVHAVDAAACALLDVAKCSVYTVVATFGPVAAGLHATQAPAVTLDKALLTGFLEQRE